MHGQQIRLLHGGTGSYVDVMGSDTSIVMDREVKAKVWDAVHDSDVVGQIVAVHGFVADAEATPSVHAEDKHTLVQRDSDLRFIRRLARRNGCLFWLTADPMGVQTAHFRRPPLDGAPAAKLAINLANPNLNALDIAWDVERPSSAVGWELDLADKSQIDGNVARSPQKLLGDKGLADITGDAPEHPDHRAGRRCRRPAQPRRGGADRVGLLRHRDRRDDGPRARRGAARPHRRAAAGHGHAAQRAVLRRQRASPDRRHDAPHGVRAGAQRMGGVMERDVIRLLLEHVRSRHFGKYRGTVTDNEDPKQKGRLKVSVPALLPPSLDVWAMPCVPYAGDEVGFYRPAGGRRGRLGRVRGRRPVVPDLDRLLLGRRRGAGKRQPGRQAAQDGEARPAARRRAAAGEARSPTRAPR